MTASIRSAALLLGASVFLATVAPAKAQPPVTGIEVSTSPSFAVVAAAGGAEVRRAPTGSSAALRVVASYADGSTRDVTADPATSYESLAPALARVSSTGELSFAASARSGAAAILVVHGAHSVLVSFEVAP